MLVLRFFITIFICTLLLSTVVKAEMTRDQIDIKYNELVTQGNLELSKQIESLDLSNDKRSLQIRNVKTGYPLSKVKALYPNSYYDKYGEVLVKTPTEEFMATGTPINNISLYMTSRAIGDNCAEQFEKTGKKLINKYGPPERNEKYIKMGRWDMRWIPQSLKSNVTAETGGSVLTASMTCRSEKFGFTLNAESVFVSIHTSKLVTKLQKEWRDAYEKMILENAPTQEINF